MARLVRWQIFLAALGILIVGGLLVQLSRTRETIVVPVRGGIYVEGMVGTPRYLNPLLATSDAERAIASLLFEGLSALQPDGSVTPAMAESWGVSGDGMVYTCTLRSDVRWHDGEAVTTEDVLFTLNLILSPDFPDPNRLAELWSQVQVQALDDRRLRFTLQWPYAPFLSYTTLPILPAHLLREVSAASFPTSAFNLNPVGSGPFRCAVREQNAQCVEEGADGVLAVELDANLAYYRDPPYLEQMRFQFYRSEGSLVEALLQEQIDGAFGLSAEALDQLAQRPDLVLHHTYLQAYTILFVNTETSLLADRRVRQAIAVGLDLPALLAPLGEEVFPANGPISPISWAYKPDLPPPEHDPDRAVALLEESGWHDLDGDGVRDRDVRSLELTLLTRDVPEERVILARRVKDQLAALGIAVRVLVLEDPDSYRERLENRDYDLLMYGWGQLGRDPDASALWHSSQIGPGGFNYSLFQNEEADWLLEQGRSVLDRETRTQLYWQFQELFVQEVPAIPIYYPIYSYAVRSRVHGVELDPLNDLGDRFRNVTGWYVGTQRVVIGRSRPAQRYPRGGQR